MITSSGILDNTEEATDLYEKSNEQETLSVAFAAVFSKSMTTDTAITAESLQEELDKAGVEATVSVDPDDETQLNVKFDKTNNQHSVDIETGMIDYEGSYLIGNEVEDILSGITFKFTPSITYYTNTDITVKIENTLETDSEDYIFEYRIGSSGTWTEYTGDVTITENTTLYARIRYLRKVSAYGTLTISNIDKTAPTINSAIAVTMTTNSASATVKATDSYSGYSKVIWYYKKASDSTWTAAKTDQTKAVNSSTKGSTSQQTKTYTYSNLSQTTSYNFKVEVYDVAGNVTTSTVTKSTLTVSTLTVTVNNTNWQSSGTKTITITATNNSSSYYSTIRYTTNGTAPTSSTGTTISSGGTFTVSANCTIYAIAYDSTNQAGATASLTISRFETTKPTVGTAISVTATTTNSASVSVKATDSTSGYSKVIWYYKKSSDSDWITASTDQTVAVNSSTTGSTSSVTKTYTYTNLAQTTNYDYKARIYDVAGNYIESSTTSNQTLTVSTLTVTVNNTNWQSSGTKTITVTAANSNYSTIRYTTNGTAPTSSTGTTISSGGTFTVSANCTIYAIAYDSTNQAGATASLTVSRFDTTKPTVGTAISVTATTTNSASVSVTATDSTSGYSKVIWYYKKSSDSDWTTASTDQTVAVNSSTTGSTSAQTKTYTYTNLAQTTNYDYKARVYDVAGNYIESSTTSQKTLTVSTLTVTVNNTNWQNSGTKTITVTAANSNYSTIRYTTNGTAPTSSTGTTISSGGTFTVSSNCTIYAIAYDSTNQAGATASLTVSRFDTTAPTVSTALNASTVSYNSFTLSITVNDSSSGLSWIRWYYYRPQDSSWQYVDDEFTDQNGSSTGTTGATTKTHSFSSLTKGGTVKAYAVVYDVAGNSVSSYSSSSSLSFNTSTYTISYNMNGGSGSISSQSKYYGVSLTLSTTTPTRSGYNFLGWSTSNSATAATWSSGGAYTTNSSNTLYAVWEKATISVSTIASNASTYYGGVVTNYGIDIDGDGDYSDDWKIFYSDGTYIFLIASDYVLNTLVPTSSTGIIRGDTYSVYWSRDNLPEMQSDADNYRSLLLMSSVTRTSSVSTLLNAANWSSFRNSTYANYAFGSPSLEMWVASWNAKGYTTLYYTRRIGCISAIGTSSDDNDSYVSLGSTSGYSDTLFFPRKSKADGTIGYWLMAQYDGSEKLYNVRYHGQINVSDYYYLGQALRPVVALKSSVYLIDNGNGTYSLGI